MTVIMSEHIVVLSDDYDQKWTPQELAEMLQPEFLGRLTDLEREIIMKRFPLPIREYSLDEIAAMFRISRERVRQIEKQACKELAKDEDLERQVTEPEFGPMELMST